MDPWGLRLGVKSARLGAYRAWYSGCRRMPRALVFPEATLQLLELGKACGTLMAPYHAFVLPPSRFTTRSLASPRNYVGPGPARPAGVYRGPIPRTWWWGSSAPSISRLVILPHYTRRTGARRVDVRGYPPPASTSSVSLRRSREPGDVQTRSARPRFRIRAAVGLTFVSRRYSVTPRATRVSSSSFTSWSLFQSLTFLVFFGQRAMILSRFSPPRGSTSFFFIVLYSLYFSLFAIIPS